MLMECPRLRLGHLLAFYLIELPARKARSVPLPNAKSFFPNVPAHPVLLTEVKLGSFLFYFFFKLVKTAFHHYDFVCRGRLFLWLATL
jgi:hypothetical protein